MSAGTFLAAPLLLVCSLQIAGGFQNGSVSATEERNVEQARQTLGRCIRFEQDQSYERLYSFLSEKRKTHLKIRTAADYQKLRESSEAHWSGFSIESESVRDGGSVLFVGHATIEETGESNRVRFTTTLVKEHGTWKIEDWKY